MLMRPEQLAAHLTRELSGIYTLYGDEPLLVIEAADTIRTAARQQGFDERHVLSVLPGFDWGDLAQAANNRSLFGGRTLIDLRIPTGKPGRDGSAALQSYCANPSPDALLLITLPGLDWSEEKAVWFKTLTEASVTLKLAPPSLADLPAWLGARLARQQQSAEPEALRFIAERVEGNLLAAHQEIQKLALLYPAKKLTLDEVREAVLNVARYDLDGLREALLAGDIKRFARTLEGLQQEGEAPPLVLWAITEEIRALAQVSLGLANKRPLDALLKEAKIWGPRQVAFKKAVQRVRAENAVAALRQATKTDLLLKGIGQGDIWQAFLRLAFCLSGAT